MVFSPVGDMKSKPERRRTVRAVAGVASPPPPPLTRGRDARGWARRRAARAPAVQTANARLRGDRGAGVASRERARVREGRVLARALWRTPRD